MENCYEDLDMFRFKEAFQLFDDNGDGFISFAELGNAMRMLNQNPTETEVKKLIQQVDKDNNGQLDYEEFEMLMKQTLFKSTRRFEEEMRAAFEVFDRDGDGVVTAEELRYYMTNLGEKMTEKEAEEMIKEADSDGDGKINYREFCQMMKPGNGF